MENKILIAALNYRDMGFSVIPVNPSAEEEIGKKPLVSWTEFQNRKASNEEITSWWGKWPKAMIGVITGSISGFFGVDADTPEALKKAEELIPDSVPTCLTPRLGKHFHFSMPDFEVRNSNDGVIHIRGEGGYVIMPPSIRSDGKSYLWINEINGSGIPPAPVSVLSYIKELALGLYKESKPGKSVEVKEVSSSQKYFIEGRRDEDLFRASNALTKGGCQQDFVDKVVEILALNCEPPFSLKEAKEKVYSAFKRSERKKRNITEEFRNWIESAEGQFEVSSWYRESNIVSKEDKHTTIVAANLFCKQGLIEKCGDKRGVYRTLSQEHELIDWENADDSILKIEFPFEIEKLVSIMPKNIIVIAGVPNAGKTAFLLNFARMNAVKWPILYFSSEMEGAELKARLKKFDGPLKQWRPVGFYKKEEDFANALNPDGINIIDFLEITDKFYLVAERLREYHKKLRRGILFVAIQKDPQKEFGRGGTLGLEKPRLYMTLDRGKLRITKGKMWASEQNPEGMIMEFKIVQGCKFIEQGWKYPETRQERESRYGD